MAILTVTLNPALDLETSVVQLRPRDKLRCTSPRVDPGGGGINVAHAIHALGGRALAAVAVQGSSGAELTNGLSVAGIPFLALPAPGPTRHNLSVIEEATGEQYRFIFPGPAWTPADLNQAQTLLLEAVTATDLVVLSGSVPPGVTGDDLVGLANALQARGAKVIVDTSGPGLAAMADHARDLCVLRMDDVEAADLVGYPLVTLAETKAVAARLVSQGVAEAVIIARGAEGSVLATRGGAWSAPAIDVPVQSLTGAGDSFVGSVAIALERGADWPEVLCCGCAAASSAVMTPATALCDAVTYADLLRRTRPERI